MPELRDLNLDLEPAMLQIARKLDAAERCIRWNELCGGHTEGVARRFRALTRNG
jgi:hypothetical protein